MLYLPTLDQGAARKPEAGSRDFSSGYVIAKDGARVPRMYRVGSDALGKCEYVQLTNKQYAAALVVNIDIPGDAGGHPAHLCTTVKETFAQLVTLLR